MTKWKIDSFTPSDGHIICGAAVDHVAWLSGTADKLPTVCMLVQFSSRGVQEPGARLILNKLVAGLNDS